jgi:uncharacterized membrane protein YecN with MAPEG domain
MYFPVTTFYASLLGILLLILSNQVSNHRKRAMVSLGHGDDSMLERAMRTQGNFVEYVPFALLLLMLLEQELSEMWLLHTLGAMLLAGRLLHMYGIHNADSPIAGRFWGTALTWLMILATSLLNLWHLI